jgi:serine/threonine-protein kinase
VDADRWRRIEDLCADALDRPLPERADFIRRACAGDGELAREVESLVDAATTDPGFLGQPLIDLARPSTEYRRIDRYRLVRALGRGGMGEVFLGIQEGDDFERSVAVKLIRRGVESDDVSRRFAQERRILARLRHPNIASLLDGGTTDDGTPYVVMEFVDGVRLDRYCRSRDLDEADRVRLMLKVCDAVQHAHRNLVIHRDLKPANILVTEEGVPKLLDFGIGKLLDSGEGDPAADRPARAPETRTGMRVLTPEYAAPEQIRGESVTTASDVFALAVIVYELVAGTHPWAGLDETERLAAIEYGPTTQENRTGGEGEGRISADLRTVLAKALRFEAERRYPTVDAFAEDLRRWLEGRPVTARPDTLGYRTARFVRRNRAAVMSSSIVLAALSAATGSVLLQRADTAQRVAAERDKLRETQGFLLEMFGAVGPDESPGSEVSARALLAAQAERIGQYDDRPELQAEIQLVLADGYQRLGLVDQAHPLAIAALDTRRALLDEDDLDVARAESLLGWIERERGDPDAAEALLRSAIRSFRGASPPAPEPLSKALNDLGVVLGDQGRYDDAVAVLAESLSLRQSGPEVRAMAVGITANNLASSYWQLQRRDEAIALMEQALATLEAELGPEHGRVWIVRANLLAFQTDGRTPDERIAAWRDYVNRAEGLFGPQHRETAWAEYQLGVSLLQAASGPNGPAHVAESRERLAHAVEVADLTYGPAHPRTAQILVGQSNGFLLERSYEESIAARARAVEIFEAAYGPDHPDIGFALRDMSRARYGLGHFAEGDRLAREAWNHHVRVLGRANVYTLVAQVNMARRLAVTGAAAEAVELLSEAAAGVDRLDPPQPGLGFQARISLARALARTGRVETADSILEAVRPRLDEVSATLARSYEQIAQEVRGGG